MVVNFNSDVSEELMEAARCLALRIKRRGGDRDGHGRQWEMGDGGTMLD